MPLPAVLRNLPLPIIGAPLFIVSNPKLVIEQCKAGVVGSMPALNARPAAQLDEWLAEITETLAAHDRAHPDRKAAPFAINQIVHRSNDRLDQDLQMCAKYKVPIVITSLGARTDLNEAVHGWGGVVLHDIINNTFAKKAIEKGADGLIAVAAGAGGHAGVKSPFALIAEIREWFDGPLALSGAIATGGGVLAALAMGADFAYIGTAFVATEEARAVDAYKEMIVSSETSDILYTPVFTHGVPCNFMKPSIRANGFDPDTLSPHTTPHDPLFAEHKPWRDIWAAGHGVGLIRDIPPVGELVARIEGDERIVLQDGRTLERSYRRFVRGYAVTSYASQGKTVDYVLFSDSAVQAATSRQQWYVTISRGRKGVRIFTADKEQLRENIARAGDRELALDLTRPRQSKRQRLRRGLTIGLTRGRQLAATICHRIAALASRMRANAARREVSVP